MPAINRIDTATRTAPAAASLRQPHEQIEHSRARELVMRAELERLAREDHREGRRYQRQYFNSYDAKLAALHTANRKQPGRPLSDSVLIGLAGDMNPWAGTDERARMHVIPKANGYRAVIRFRVINMALQVLYDRAVGPFAPRHPRQYDAPGNGGDWGACRRILELLGAGYVHVLVADVSSNYNSLAAAGLRAMLPAPHLVTDSIVLGRGLNIIVPNRKRRGSHDGEAGGNRADAPAHRHKPKGQRCHSLTLRVPIATLDQGGADQPSRWNETTRKGRQGIPQGSVCSPLVSRCVHAPIVRTLSEMAEVVQIADNYFILARTRDELLPVAKTLKAEFQQSPAGPLLFSKCIIVDARHGFRCLGFVFKAGRGRVWLRPSRGKLERHWWRFTEMIDDVALGKMTREGAVESLDGWCAAHRLWLHWRLWRKLLMGRLDQHFPPPTEVDG